MTAIDFFSIFKWFSVFFLVGLSFLPLNFFIFPSFKDKGYIFSKIIGSIIISYSIFIFGFLHLFKFSTFSIYFLLVLFAFINYFYVYLKKIDFFGVIKKHIKIFIFEEVLFFTALLAWSYVRGNMPDINGLEKFMDFGFLNSILRTDYFPPKDMWYTPFSINYYYFGHLITAVYSKMSAIPNYVSYNLMISALFALTFTSSFSIGLNLFNSGKYKIKPILAGLLTSLILTLGGNLTTIYTFFKPYIPADNPVPFWNLSFLPFNFPNNYWYPNATRFIPFTIHEFPIYSFVVSDLHGHVLDIPIVFLTIATIFSFFVNRKNNLKLMIFLSFLFSIMYMTNVWDGLIYLLLGFIFICFSNLYQNNKWGLSTNNLYELLKNITVVFAGFITFLIPFSINFKPFVSGIGVLCAPSFLTSIGKFGPFLFEANHCQRSPLWQLALLYGFFYFFIVCLIVFLKFKKNYKFSLNDKFVLILIFLSTVLITIPEFIYVKDIYPLHYRANTMFKLVYEAFIMLSIVSSFILVKLLSEIKNKFFIFLFSVISLLLLSLIFIYPFFAINSYYRNFQSYRSLDGIKYLQSLYPADYDLINWMNKNIKGQPVILEANGDSYTNYARISANTGLPTILGWTVHEWLWRGTYNIVAPRISDVETLYTSNDMNLVATLIKKYNISYIVVSALEKEKYPNLNDKNFDKFGRVVFRENGTKLYKINTTVLAK